MRTWRQGQRQEHGRRAGVRCLLPTAYCLLLFAGCASVPAPCPARETLLLDQSTHRSGLVVFSTPAETTAMPVIAFTAEAFKALAAWTTDILQDRCRMRAGLGAAPDPLCEGLR